MLLGMCAGVLDEKVGPTLVFRKNLSEEIAKKLVLKIMIGVMSFSDQTDEKSLRGESIIPFIKDGLITFAYLFPKKDSKARGGLRQCSLIVAFDAKDRKVIYENATTIAKILKGMSEQIELKHIQTKTFPNTLLKDYEKVSTTLFSETRSQTVSKETKLAIVCPLCSKNIEIKLPSVAKGVNFIEHQVEKNDICSHTFTVYLDSKFNVLGYKDPDVEIKDMKSLFGKLKSPYD